MNEELVRFLKWWQKKAISIFWFGCGD